MSLKRETVQTVWDGEASGVSSRELYDVAIIGGGAAGLFSASLACEGGLSAIVIEPNKSLGRKLRITGKGRCNLTNNCSSEEVIRHTLRNPRFLYSSVYSFSPDMVMEWFSSHGVELKTERGGRVFPVSDRADDVADAMAGLLEGNGVPVVRDRAKSLRVLQDGLIETGCTGTAVISKNVIIATGGLSYPKTGSTGDGYRLAAGLGHSVIPPSPSLVPVTVGESFVGSLTGLTLKNVTVSLCQRGRKKPVFSQLGELSFMPYGISGPLTLSASSYMEESRLKNGEYTIYIDLKPGLSHEKLAMKLNREFSLEPRLSLGEYLRRLLPAPMAETVNNLLGIACGTLCSQLNREQRRNIINILKELRLTPTGLRSIDEAIVTRGGIPVGEIDPGSMESRLVKGVYFAGEIIDVDAFTGGYNLQIAFSTAHSAVSAIIQSKKA